MDVRLGTWIQNMLVRELILFVKIVAQKRLTLYLSARFIIGQQQVVLP